MNTRQSLFIGYYVASLNATQSALDAGYSPKTAYSQGQRLLKNVEVQEALVISKAALAERAEITAVDVLKMLQREAAAGDLDVPNSARIRAQELIGKHIGCSATPSPGRTPERRCRKSTSSLASSGHRTRHEVLYHDGGVVCCHGDERRRGPWPGWAGARAMTMKSC